MRTPSYGEVEEFCRLDGWTPLRPTDHQPYRKVLVCPDGNIVLDTHVSFDRKKSMSHGRWRAILRHQLACTEEDFWNVLHAREPLSRPCPPRTESPTGPIVAPNVMRVLSVDLHMSATDIEQLTTQQALELAQEYWSRSQ